jgi:VCBS repeat-containing protein
MIIWGGTSFYLDKPIGSRYDPVTDIWTDVNKNGSPVTREWPVNVWTGSEMLVWGGQNLNSGEIFNDGGRYNPTTNSWKRTSQIGAPSARVGQGVWTGAEMVIWGGDWDSSGGRYNPASDSWRATSRVNAPPVRAGGRWSTVWTGSQMIIWGGIIETQQGNLYCASGMANVAPVAGDDSYTAKQNKQLVVGSKAGALLNDSDANADLLTAQRVSKPSHGALTVNSNGSFIYKPVKGFTGPDSFTYQANDGLANSNTATVSITVQ